MTAINNLIFAIVAVLLPLSAVSMQTENGYLCNLCHSLQNEFPYPPPAAESRPVRLTKVENEQFGTPFERGSTCLEVWNTVLDFANPNVHDEESCRSMAQPYAWQCCNIEPVATEDPPQEQETSTAETSVEGLTLPQVQDSAIVSRLRNIAEEKPRQNRSPEDRIATTTMGTGRGDVNDAAISDESLSLRQDENSQKHRPLSDRISTSDMGTGGNDASSGSNNNNVRRVASTSYLRGK